MNTPIAPTNNLIVQIDKKFQEEILTESGIRLYQDTTYRPEWHVTVTGWVVSVPRLVDGYQWDVRGRMLRDIQVGDEIAFSYLVVFDLAHTDNRDEVYYEDPMESPFLTQYSNRLGRKILIRYRMQDDLFDVGLYDENGIVYEIKERLSAVEKENYLGNFPFAETNQISYNNLLELAGREYWTVDYGHVLAVRQGQYLTPASGKAILSVPEMTMSEHEDAGIVLLNEVRTPNQAEAKIIALGAPLEGEKYLPIEPGDRVLFDKRYAERYELWGAEVLVLPHKRLLAKV